MLSICKLDSVRMTAIDSSLKVRTLSEILQKKAESELNEDPSRLLEDIQHLKEWLKTQPHLTVRQDDHFLLCFLRTCKFSLQKSKEKLDYFYTIRTLWSEFYSDRNPMQADLQRALAVGAILPLPQLMDAAGPRFILVRWGVCNPSTMPYALIMKVMFMITDILMQEDDNLVVGGIHFIVDYKEMALSYAVQMTPRAVQRTVNSLQSAYPLRLKGIDFINVPTIVDGVFAIVKSILAPKLRDRANSYTLLSEYYNRVSKEVLPEEYGGKSESVKDIADRWKRKVESYSQWFEEDAQYGSDESLRPEESKTDMFGVDGTFRKLAID